MSNKTVRAFYWCSQAWYAEANGYTRYNDKINFGMYHKDGGTDGEMSVKWIELGNGLCPKLEVFDDAWKILSEFSDVIDKLAQVDGLNVSPDEIVNILLECGFQDFTPRENPYL